MKELIILMWTSCWKRR